MFATIKKTTENRKLVAVISKRGDLIMATGTPRNKDNGYPAHVIGDVVTMTTGDLIYWSDLGDCTLVYEGDAVTLQF